MADGEGSELVRDLLKPSAYGRGHTAPVALRTTHASWVFLTDHEVWKVKRPVNFGFLDFRTLDARRRACEDEVRLNRRLAPDVYLGVESVRMTPNGHALRGEGPTVDWAVHMRRLPDDASAEALLARGDLDAGRLAEIADRLASFLASARPAPDFGAPDALRRNVAENVDQVTPFVGDLLEQATLDEVRTLQMGQLSEHAERFDRRLAENRIRDGHGDLRLEHLYLLPDPAGRPRPVIIDCIEFNERFRCGDTAAEVAFLAMELEAAGRRDLADGFLARYAEASDDFGLYGVVDFYLSYRAFVRGKVAAFVAADATASSDVRRRKRDEARRDFSLARSFAGRPFDRPFLIAVGGIIGSGKSTLAAALGRRLAVPVVSSDRTRKVTAGLAVTSRGGASLYDPAARDRTYAEIVQRATDILSSGRSLVLDATFAERRWRLAAADVAHTVGASFVFLEARCEEMEVIRARLAERRGGGSISDATDDLLDEFLRHYQPLGSRDPDPRYSVDTEGTPEVAVQQALAHLRSSGITTPADRLPR